MNLTPDTRHPTPRRGITLIELLVVILILTILAALVLGVAAVAGETAREAQSRHTVERLHTLLMEFYDKFKTRRVHLNPAVETKLMGMTSLTAAEKRKFLAECRLYALRELMLMEVPDRWSDVLLNPVPTTLSGISDSMKPIYLDPAYLSAHGRTELAEAYLRRYQAIATSATPPKGETLTDNQGAECLYMVIMMACGDGEARTLFAESSIGDTDGDGAPEFLDGWGHPINFLRWAPGFESPIQLNANNYADTADPKWKIDAAKDHDPFDLFRNELIAYRLIPLIYSGGRDETFGIRLVKPYVTWQGVATAGTLPITMLPLTPYKKISDPDIGDTPYLGTLDADGTATDNIHNHLMGQR